jgi:hypothetical protein
MDDRQAITIDTFLCYINPLGGRVLYSGADIGSSKGKANGPGAIGLYIPLIFFPVLTVIKSLEPFIGPVLYPQGRNPLLNMAPFSISAVSWDLQKKSRSSLHPDH